MERIQTRLQTKNGKRVLVAVAGVPGSGKTTLVTRLERELNAHGVKTSVLPQDGYHYYRAQLAQFADPAEAFRRRGAPFTFDGARFVAAVRKVHAGETVLCPLFDHAKKDPVEDDIVIDGDTKVVLIEGNYVGLQEEPWGQLAELVDELWMVQAETELVRERIVKRHMASGIAANEEEARERADGSDWQNALYIMSHTREPDVVVE